MLSPHATAMVPKIQGWVKAHQGHLWTALIVGLVAWSAYNLGIIRGRAGATPLQEAAVFRAREGIVPQASVAAGQGSQKPGPDRSDLRVVVSKSSSSKKYHHSWCASGKKIKEENRVWFPSAEAAQAAGYTLAGNCTP